MTNSKLSRTPLGRRREASYRLPPLECGRRDPLDPLPSKPSSTEVDAWLAAYSHLGALGHNVTFALPAEAQDLIGERK